MSCGLLTIFSRCPSGLRCRSKFTTEIKTIFSIPSRPILWQIQHQTVWSWWLLFCSQGWSCPPLSRYPETIHRIYTNQQPNHSLLSRTRLIHSFHMCMNVCIKASQGTCCLLCFHASLSFGAVYVHNTDNPAHSMCLCETSSNYYIWQPNIMNV